MSLCPRTALALGVSMLLAAAAAVCGSPPSFAATAKPTAACVDATHRQFDFWIGDWDTFDSAAPDKPMARNHVDSILDGCVLREIYEQTDGLAGHSFTIYDTDRHLWHQSWVTNHGQLLVLEGRQQGKQIVLNGVDHGDSNALVRVSWAPVADGVRETASLSRDGGKTWRPSFDIVFRRHSP